MESVLNLHRSLCLWCLSPARGRGIWVRGGGGEGGGGGSGGDGSDGGGESATERLHLLVKVTCLLESPVGQSVPVGHLPVGQYRLLQSFIPWPSHLMAKNSTWPQNAIVKIS